MPVGLSACLVSVLNLLTVSVTVDLNYNVMKGTEYFASL
jgi:hypothetical protein